MPENNMQDIKDFWKAVLAELQIKADPLSYKTALAKLKVANLTETSIDILCNTDFYRKDLQKRFGKQIEGAVNKIAGTEFFVNYEIDKSPVTFDPRTVPNSSAPLFTPQQSPDEIFKERSKKAGLSPKFTFENYIQGNNNQLAYAIAMAVAEKPGEVYNPVFFYSGVGLGKTHLMQAIGNRILQRTPSVKIVYTTGEAFTNELIESIQGGKRGGRYTSNEFRDKFRKADVLLIDDIQFIAGKESTQEEFFHTFNALYMTQKQIIITSDRPPKDFINIAERITSRFNSGIIADIQTPDYETKVAILRSKRDKNNDPITNEAISVIAEKVSTNIRELEGAYLRVLTNATTTGREIDEVTVLEILGQTIKDDIKKPVNMNSVLKAVCNYYSVKSADLKGSRRTKELVIPRQVAMYLIKELTETPYMSIGEFLGGRDHTTIMHGVEKISGEVSHTAKTKQDVINVKQMIFNE